MGQKLYFMNNGNFDVRAMLTFGVSAKEKDDAIGYFGTGFKYAVAIILRLHGSIHIETREAIYEFTSRRENIRGKEFDVVLMNGAEAGFTTHLGANWEPWMAFRELYCNCTDEQGIAGLERKDFDTVITVDCDLIAQAYADRGLYFIDGDVIASSDEVQVYAKPSKFYFYRGVAVRNLPRPAMFAYNIRSRVELTEDRTAKYDYQLNYPIQRMHQNATDSAMCRKVLTASPESFEGIVQFDPDYGASDEFVETTRQLIASGIGVRESARRTVQKIDDKAGNWPEFLLTKSQLQMLRRAITFLKNIGVDPEQFEIRCVQGLGDGVMGRAIDGVIFLSDIPFQLGTKQVASTLLEEWVHNKYGCKDFDRAMQSWLFDKVLSIGEELVGEPV